jgi:hypothetical protein
MSSSSPDHWCLERSHHVGMTSQKTKPSRSTTSPVSQLIGSVKIGPAWTKVWNSPFSPQGIYRRREVGEELLVICSPGERRVYRARVQADDDRLETSRDELSRQGAGVASPQREQAALAGCCEACLAVSTDVFEKQIAESDRLHIG